LPEPFDCIRTTSVSVTKIQPASSGSFGLAAALLHKSRERFIL